MRRVACGLITLAVPQERVYAASIVVVVYEKASTTRPEFFKLILDDVLFTSSFQRMSDSSGQMTDGFTINARKVTQVHGVLPPPQETVQPEHRHLINHLKFLSNQRLRKPGSL